jgi:hypothetical protein
MSTTEPASPMPRFTCGTCGTTVYGQLGMRLPCGWCGGVLVAVAEDAKKIRTTPPSLPTLQEEEGL